MNEQVEFQRFARILSRYRGGALRLGEGFAEIPPARTQPEFVKGPLGGECFLLGEKGAREWTANHQPSGRWAAHLWDAMPGVAEKSLRAAGFERRWSNSILEARVNAIEISPASRPGSVPEPRFGGEEVAVSALSSAQEYEELVNALGSAHVPVRASEVRVLAIRVGGTWVGSASLTFDDEVAYFADLYVDPARRGRGYGRALIEAAFEHAARKGCLRVWTLPSEKARPLYERAGFRPAALLSTYLS